MITPETIQIAGWNRTVVMAKVDKPERPETWQCLLPDTSQLEAAILFAFDEAKRTLEFVQIFDVPRSFAPSAETTITHMDRPAEKITVGLTKTGDQIAITFSGQRPATIRHFFKKPIEPEYPSVDAKQTILKIEQAIRRCLTRAGIQI